MKTIDWILRVVAVSLVILIIIVLPRSCGLTEKYLKLKGEHDALLVERDSLKKEKADVIAASEADKEARDAEIALAQAEIAKKNAALKDKDKRIATLEGEFANLPDDAARIANLQAQVAAWKEKFSIAEGIIADKDKIIFDLTAKYEAEVKISDAYKALYINADSLYNIQVDMNKELEKVVSHGKTLGTVKTVGMVALGLIAGYLLVGSK